MFASLALLLTGAAVAGEPVDLPRKASGNESYPGVTVLYDAVRDAQGHRLRVIATHPRSQGPFPTIFVVGWLSCDTVEAPPGTRDGTQLMLQAMARIPGFATVRLEKPGVGDSEGDCGRTDFITELAAYRLAFQHLGAYEFVDSRRLFLFGMSNGGGFAPLVADGAPVKGYVVDGGWIKTWYEHMLEIERRRLVLAGHRSADMNRLMKSVERLYSAWLLEQQPLHQVLAREPQLRQVWDGTEQQQYGRPLAYYQQLQELDLMAAWSRVRVPVLALHGEYDWIMSRGDFELLVDLVNSNVPASAKLVDLPHTGHTFEHYDSLQGAFTGPQLPFDDGVAQLVTSWFLQHQQ
jgi:pimeloyl-ACP methyl ester carboxylesterase